MTIDQGGRIAPAAAALGLLLLLGAGGSAAAMPQPLRYHGSTLLTGGSGEDAWRFCALRPSPQRVP